MTEIERNYFPDYSGEAFCPLSLWLRFLMTIGPLLAYGLILLVAAILSGRDAAFFLLSMTIGGFIGGGKLVILAGAVSTAPVKIWTLAGLVVYVDIATALIIMANMHLLYRIPALGRRLAMAREAGFRVLTLHKWMRRAAEIGLSLFIAVPFQGTGAVLGVVLGRILGLSRLAIFFTILGGSTVGSVLVAFVGNMGRDEITKLVDAPLLGLAAVGGSLLTTFLLGRWFVGQNRSEKKITSPK